ncbi:ABC transporter permease [Candidatus Chrysopegis kryptomonas]|uniref:ABC-type transport system, involved in lipoprotein release, permease component n=1 Tax=Candidatus Chryseopegocella kryptomonas TaxID=1633643 RepID=A0A0P1N067_9BACT|nr:ABC transporter permease [Candidatus Chrysopegis kryptomonas]CUT01766.1 ABC-type transport system, involved in lipoprotein release, permease component [Candidatus Chrysopegis kryptomonas]
MIFKLAWRNIWRNKRRTLIVVVSIVVSVSVLLLIDTLSMGMMKQMLDNQINLHIAHIQIHKRGFNDDKTLKNYIPDSEKIEEVLRQIDEIKFYSRRVISYGLINSAFNSSGVIIVGVEPEREKNITIISRSIVEGKYIGEDRGIILGKKLAQKLNVEIGDKVVLMVSDLNGNVSSDVFRVIGLYESPSSEFDKVYVYIPIESAQQLLGLGDKVIEFALILKDQNFINSVKDKIARAIGNSYEVLSYDDISPLIRIGIEMYKELIWIYYLIFGIAVGFGVVNIMLMSVFERVREFGVLKAIGMKNKKIFALILLESFMIGVVGTIIGLVIGLVLYLPLSKTGVDLGIFAESLAWFGSGRIIYPVLTEFTLSLLIFTMPFISLIGAIYPAIKSIKFEPVEALKHI